PFFIAGIDKMFTFVLIGSLEEQGKLSYEVSIGSSLDSDLLHDLHIYKGKDYTNKFNIQHFLKHTSRIFGDALDQPTQRISMMELLLDEPSQPWTSHYIIHWSKEHLKVHFPPGEGFHY